MKQGQRVEIKTSRPLWCIYRDVKQSFQGSKGTVKRRQHGSLIIELDSCGERVWALPSQVEAIG